MKSELITLRILDDLKQEMIDVGLVTAEQLKVAEKESGISGESIGRILIDKGFVTSEKMLDFMGERLHIPFVNLENYKIDKEVIKLVPRAIAHSHKVIPLFEIEGVLTIAMADPVDIISLDSVIKVTKGPVETVISSEESVLSAIDKWYGVENVGDKRQKLVDQFTEEFKERDREEKPQFSKEITEIPLMVEGKEQPVVKLVNSFLAQAIDEGASDIHLEPKKDSMVVRFRIDGFLYNRQKLPTRLIAPITSRIKVMSGLDISKKRIPQDGRISLVIRDKGIDVRTATFPSMYGENVVLRILDKTMGIFTLSELGLSDKDLNIFKRLIRATKGVILATGPTGSGKTTTIYSTINVLNKVDKNIMTIEDPIEYEIEGIVQSQVNPKAGVTFVNALGSILRQDPDIVYVGEIRDLETADIAMRAALTGHLVLSTLHTNNAVGAILRLSDIGVDAVAIESALTCSFSQRLVRKICRKCIKAYKPDEGLLKRFRLSLDTKFYRGEGCESCNGIGYRGRTGIFEVLTVDDNIRKLIRMRASEDEIMKAAKAQGMRTLFVDGMLKVIKGITTLEEIKRVTEEAG